MGNVYTELTWCEANALIAEVLHRSVNVIDPQTDVIEGGDVDSRFLVRIC